MPIDTQVSTFDIGKLLGNPSGTSLVQSTLNQASSSLLNGASSAITNALSGNITGLISQGVNTLMSVFSKSGTSLAEEKQRVAQELQILEQLMTMRNDDNVQETTNEIERFSAYWYYHTRNSLARRTWSSQTTEGYTYHRDTLNTFRNQIFSKYLNDLSSMGYKVSSTLKTVTEQSLEDIYNSGIAPDNTTAEKNGNIQYRVFTITGTAKTNQTGNLTEMVSSGANKMGGGLMAVIFGGLILGTIFMKKKS